MKDIKFIKDEIEKDLKGYFEKENSYASRLYEAMDYSLNIGGKRIRPLLFLLSYTLFKEDYRDVFDVALAIEMIHTYSLIHDDLPSMDNDDLRRGKPTNHKVYGEALAILAGDGLLNEAMNLLFKYCKKNPSKNSIMAASYISESAGAHGMIGGQVVDILSENEEISIDKLKYIHENKTGALIKASIISGAILSLADQSDIKKLEHFGENLGLAFQIKDDILDIIGDQEKIGKPVKSDVKSDKATYVKFYGLDICKEKCESLTIECIDILVSLNRDTKNLERLTLELLKREN